MAASMNAATILVVEDEAVVALDLKMQLEDLGYRVVGIADTAADAVLLARRHRPSLALMDIQLRASALPDDGDPAGDAPWLRDGIDAARVLQRELDVPVIFLTSFSDAETVQRAARTSAYGYLTKPFQIKELRAGIEIALWKAGMEHQLRESERWFASTLRCVQDGIVLIDPVGAVQFMNAAAEQLLGWTIDEAGGRPVAEVVQFAETPAGDDRSGVTLGLEALATGRVVGVRLGRQLTTRQGRRVAVDESAGPIHDERGESLGAVLVLRDAGERVRLDALLHASEERFRSSFEFAPLGMALVALDGRFLQVNEAMCTLLRSDPVWLKRQTQAALTHPADSAHEAARLAELRQGEVPVTQFEKRYRRARPEPGALWAGTSSDADDANTDTVWVLVHVSMLTSADAPSCYLYQVHDLSAQKEAAARLADLVSERVRREASELANRSKNEFLSRVSHEMRTPLNAVLGFAQLLQVQEASGAPLSSQFAQHIVAAGKHLLALVDDVLDLQRLGDGSLRLLMGAVEIEAALAEAIAMLQPMADAAGVRLVMPPLAPDRRLRLRADDMRLRQVLLNLGSNAVKYSVRGGVVAFSASLSAPDRVQVCIEDRGIGMSPEQRAHLFEPFNRLGREASTVQGVGLGLVITLKLVEQMGGSLAIDSQTGAGTRVTLDFPRAIGA